MNTQILLSMIGVILGVALVMYLSFQGVSALFSAVAAAAVMLLFSGLDVQNGVLKDYAGGLAAQVSSVLMMYYGTCLFAGVMNATNCTQSVAEFISSRFGVKYSCTALMIIGILLRLGGLNTGTYLIMFDLGIVMLSKADYSENVLFATIVGACMTFACSGPFFPSTHNNLVQNAWGTTPSAGLVPGLASAIVQAVLTILFLEFLVRRWQKKGKGFTAWNLVKSGEELEEQKKHYPNVVLALVPFVVVILTYNIWHLPLAICCLFATITATILNIRKFKPREWLSLWAKGFTTAIPMVMGLSAMTGLGAVVKTTPFFSWIFDVMSNSTWNPLLLLFVSSSVITAAVGSAGSAITLSLTTLEPFIAQWQAAGYTLGTMQRVLINGAIWPSILPTNGIVSVLNEICHTDCKRSYGPAMVVGILIPFIGGAFVCLPLAMMGL